MKLYATKILGALLLWLLAPGLVFAQTGSIVGTVADDETGEPLPGATIFLPDLNTGTSVDLDGNFEVANVPEGEHRLRASFVGFRDYTTRVEVAAGEEVTLDIAMQPDVLGLDQIVVTGYGVQRKRDVTGSISSIRAQDIEIQPIVSADQALQGRTAGVMVTGTSGEPGGGFDVRVRGTGSITAGAQPLYVIDGVPMTTETDIGSQASTNPLAGIRASDIESIEVLKDAAAASIYGAQAANGVVLITTRRGEAGRTQIRAEARVGQVTDTQRFDMVNTDEWVILQEEAWGNRAMMQPFMGFGVPRVTYQDGVDYFREAFLTQEQREMLERGESLPTYDWQDAAMQTGLLQEYSITARGGTEATRFYVTGSYDFREGQFIRSDFERYSLRANLDHQVSDRLSFETNLSVSNNQQQGSIRDGNFINGVLFGAPLVAPNVPLFDEDGTWNLATSQPGGWPFGNPIQAVDSEDRLTNTRRILTNAAANYEIIPDLFFRTNIGVDYSLYRDKNYRPPVGYYAPLGAGFEASREVINYNINPVLNYTTLIDGVHNLNALVGSEYRREYRETHTVSGQGYPSEFFRRISSAAEITAGTGTSTEYKILGFFTRGQYNFDNRYYITASARYDGSSRFGADRRWGFFYSGSLGWDIAQEAFMEGVEWLDQLQPRISYGTTGNSEIGNFAARGLYGSTRPYRAEPNLRPTQLANPILTWEHAATFNAGVDLQFLRGRLFASVEAFRTINRSLLLDRELPIDSGFGDITENVGRVQNEGLEIEVGSVNIDHAGFRWRSDFNISFVRNEVLELVDDAETFGSGTGYVDNEPGTILVGEPIHVYYMPRWAGVNPADGRPMWYDADGEITYFPDTVLDAQVVGSPYSDYWGGFNNRFTFRGLSLDVNFQYDFGADTFKQQQTFFYETPQWQGGMTRNQLRRWQEPGDVTDVPRMYQTGIQPGADEARRVSSRHLADRSYIRLKQLRVAYQLPTSLTGAMGLQNMGIYIQGHNLLTWTAYDGMDPEIQVSARGYYPQPRTFSSGIIVDF